jgi:DNA polymerase-1
MSLDAGRAGHALESLAERTFNHAALDINELIKAGKAKITFDAVGIDQATEYAAEDADITLRLWRCSRRGSPPRACARSTRRWSGRCRRCWRTWSGAASLIDRNVLSRLSGEFAQEAWRTRGRDQQARGRAVQPGSPEADRRHPVRQDGPAGGKKTKTGVNGRPARVLEELAERAMSCRADSRLAPGLES